MTYLICDFMGDSLLKKLSEKLIQTDPLNFKYLISHTAPNPNSILANLQHTDANHLYSVDRLYATNCNLSYPIVDPIKDNSYLDCLQTFLVCFDRTDPIGIPVRERINYFWVLLGFYEDFFKKRPDDILNIVLFPFVLLLGFSVIASYRNSGSNVLKNFKTNNTENEILI